MNTIKNKIISLIMIFILRLFKCITCFSSLSLEDIKLVAIVIWIFDATDFLRSLMISFKYVLILLIYSLIDSFNSISDTYWLIMIFFFMLKKVPNIFNYYVFDCFIFFFQSKKILHICNYGDIYFYFYSKRNPYIFN